MDQRELEWTLFLLETEKAGLVSELREVKALLKRKNLNDTERVELLHEKDDLRYEIRECELDIGVYTELLNSQMSPEIGACGYPCDGRCQQCGGTESYDPRYEIFTCGDY